MTKPKSNQTSQLPEPRKVVSLEPTAFVLPPQGTSHRNTNINVEAHLVIRETRKFIVAMVLLTLFVVAAIFGS